MRFAVVFFRGARVVATFLLAVLFLVAEARWVLSFLDAVERARVVLVRVRLVATDELPVSADITSKYSIRATIR